MRKNSKNLDIFQQIMRNSRNKKSIPSLLAYVLIGLGTVLTTLIFTSLIKLNHNLVYPDFTFRTTVAGDIVIRIVPSECSGWIGPGNAKSIDLLGSSETEDFNTENSASFTNNPNSDINSADGFESANNKLICGGFHLSENIPAEATDITGTVSFSFASDTFKGNEDIVVFSYSLDGGTKWIPMDSFALLEQMNNLTKEGYWTYPINDLNSLQNENSFLIKAEYIAEPNEKPSTAYVDGVALDIKYFENRKPEEIDFLDTTIDVPADEQPEFHLEVEHESKFAFLGVDSVEKTIEKVIVQTPDLQIMTNEFEQELNKDGASTIATLHLTDENFTTPGIYTVTVLVKEDGVINEIVEQFAWGVLVINSDKSTYQPDETPLIGMGVLDSLGNTLCNADLTLTITTPDGKKLIKKTNDGSITLSKECGPDTVTMIPDYSTTFPIPESGEYTMNLTAMTEAGFYEINDSLIVQEDIPFSVTRRAPTRIWPMADYQVFLDVIPRNDYFGVVEEFLPENFEVVSIDQNGNTLPIQNGRLPIQWHVDWNAGESYTLSYTINPPDISPELFLLGPASWPDYRDIASNDPLAIAPGWTELRQWQIASDAVAAAFATRLFTSGFERNSVTANHEFTGTSGTAPTISTSTVRSGTYSLRTNASSATSGGYFDYATGDTGTARVTYRAYLRVASLPSADTLIMGFYDGAALGTAQVSIHLDNSGNLKLCNDEDDATCSSPIGTASSAVSTNTWYRIELAYDFGTAATGDTAAYAQIDGNVFASSTTLNHANGTRRIVFGTYSSSISADMYWDDLGLNQDAFVGQQNWVGEGKVVLLLPDGDGTSNTWSVGTNSNNYLEVDDPPSTGFDDATTYVECVLTTDVEDYNLQSTASVGINANDRIRLVEGWSRARSTTATQSESSVSVYNGSVAEVGTRNGIASASWWTNDDTVPRANSVVIYNDVGTTNHTPITPSDIDAYDLRLTTADCTPAHQVTAVWALVEYVPAEGGRLHSSGFELNSLTSGVEWDTVAGTLNIDGTTKRSGSYALRVQSLASGTEESVAQTIASANDNGAFFLRTYLNVATKPATNTENRIAEIKDSGGTPRAYLTLRADASNNLTLRLYEDDGTAAQVGSDSSVLSTSTWYRVEMKFDASGAGSTDIAEAKIDGTTFASASNLAFPNGVTQVLLGGNLNGEAQTTGDWYFDDVGINKNVGVSQNSYPGDGKIVVARPNADGDNSGWTNGSGCAANDYECINEVTPDDSTTDLLSVSAVNTLTDVGMEDSSTLGISASDTIQFVTANVRMSISAAATMTLAVRMKDASAGPIIESNETVGTSTTWFTNLNSAPRPASLTAYTRPHRNTAWDTTALDGLQLGIREVIDTTSSLRVATMWATIEYSPPTVSVSGNVYNENSSTALTECDGSTTMISLRAGNTTYTEECADADGAFTFPAVSGLTGGTPMILWIEGQTPDGATVNQYSGSGNVTGLTVQENSVTIHNDHGLSVPDNSDLDTYDNGNDDDINYTVTSSNLTIEDGHRLLVKTNENFTPGGTITTSPASTQSAMDGDIYLETGATLGMGTNALSIGGDFTTAGTVSITFSSGQTTTFTGTTTGFAIEAEDAFQNLVFNGTGGGWDFDQDATVSGDITMTAGTLSGTDNMSLSGNFSGTGGTVNKSGGTVTMGGTTNTLGAPPNWFFSGLTIASTTTQVTGSYITVNGTLTVNNGSTLSIDSTKYVFSTSTGTVTNNGTISGDGILLVANSNLSAGGTLSSDVVFGPAGTTITIPARTYGGDFTVQNDGTTRLSAGTTTISGNLFVENGEPSESATLDASTNDPNVTIAGNLDNTIADGSTTLQLGAGTWTIGGSLDFSDITSVTYDTGNTIVMTGTGNFISGAYTLYNLTINGNGNTVTATLDDINLVGTLTIGGVADGNNDTLLIDTGTYVISATTGTVTLVGSGTDSITGAGTLVLKNSNLGTGGTLSSTVRFDVTNGSITMPARTYAGTVQAYSNSALSSFTVTIGAGTHNISGSLNLIANNSTPVSLNGGLTNPTVNITGDLDYTGNGSGTETLVTGNGIWTIGGNVDFTGGSTTISTGNTLKMNGSSKSLTSAGVALQNFEISGGSTTQVAALDINGTFTVSSGGFTQAANNNLNIAEDFTLSSGTTFTSASGSGLLIFDGDLVFNDGTSPKQDLGNVHIGTSPDTTDLASDFAAKSLTVNSGDVFNTNGYDVDINTGGISISGTFDATDDVETDETQINCAGSFSINSGATFTADQSTLIMDAGSGTSNLITDGAFSLYNLTINDGGGSLTVEVEDALDVNNDVTIIGGNLDATTGEGNAITVGGNWDNDDTYTAQGNTVTFDATSGTKTIDADGTGTDSFYDLIFNDGGGSAQWTLTGALDVNRNLTITGGNLYNTTGSYNINIGGGYDNDDTYTRGTETITFDATSGTHTIDALGTGADDLYNVTFNDGGGSATWQLVDNFSWVYGTTTLTDGVWDLNNYYWYSYGNFNKTGGSLQMNQSSDYLLFQGTFTISGAEGADIYTYGTIQVQDDFTVSGDNTFVFGGAGGPRVVFTGTKDPTISISGANNVIGSSSIGAYFDIAFTNSTNTLTFLSTVNAGHCRAMEGKFVINGQNVRCDGVYYGYAGSGIDMATGSLVIGRESYPGGTYSPFWYEAGATESISGGTIQVYGSAHATYGTTYFANGSNFTPTGGTFQLMGTSTASIYIAEVDVADFNFWSLTLGSGSTKTVEVHVSSATPVDVNGDLTISSSATFDTNTEPLEVAGNWTNSGTFTADSGTVTLNGSATQTMSGTMTSTSAFYDLTITNSSGSYTGCDTAFTPGIDFAASATATNNYTITTGNVKVEYNSGSTYTFTNINWAGTAGNEIIFRNSNLTSGTWLLNVSGTQTVSYVSVARSDASSGSTIDADDGTNTNCANNTNWNFSVFTVSGNVYNVNTTTALTECDSSTNMVNLRVQSTTYQANCNDSTGAFTFSGVAAPTTNEAMILWIDGQTPDGTTINKYSGSGNVTGIIVEENALTIQNDSSVAVSNTDLDTYDNGNDDDIIYTVTTSNLTVEDTHRIIINTDENFTPGGTITTSPSATQTDMDGDIYLKTGATLNMAANALSIGGDFTSAGDIFLTLSAGQTTTFTATAGATYFIEAEDAWQNIVINGGATADWGFDAGATVNGNLTLTSGEINLAGESVFAGDISIALDGAFDTVKFMNYGFTVGGSWDNDGDFDGWESEVTFNASSGTETIDGDGILTEKFTNIVFDDGGGGTTWELTSALTTGNLTITGGTLDANGYDIGVTDNWDNDDTFIHDNNLVSFNGALATFSIDADGTGTDAFYDVSLSGATSAYYAQSTDMIVENDLTILTSTLDIGNYTLYVGGDLTNSYRLVENSGHIVMNGGAGTHIIDTSEADTAEYGDFYDLAFSDGGAGATYKSYYPLDLDGSLTIPGGSLDMEEAQTYYLTSSSTNAVTNNRRIKTVDPAGTADSTSICGDNNSNQSNLYCVLLPGSSSSSWGSEPSTIQQRGYMLSDNQGISGTYAAGNWTVNATVTQATGQWSYSAYRLYARLWKASTALGSASAITNWAYAAVTPGTTSDVTITFSGISEQALSNEIIYVEFAAYFRGTALDLGSGSATTMSLTVNEGGTKQKITTPSFAPQINVAGSWDNDDIFYHTGGTVIFDPVSGTKTIDSTGATEDDFYNLIINDGVATSTVQLAGTNLQVDNNFTLTEGSFDLNGKQALITGNFAKTGGNLLMDQSLDHMNIDGNFTVSGDGGSSALQYGSIVVGGDVAISNNNVFQMGNNTGYPVFSMDGAVSKTITVSGTGNYFGSASAIGEFDIDKTGGAVVNVGSDLDIWNLVQNTGGLTINSNYTVDTDGQYVGFGGVLTMTNGTLSVGSDNLAPSSLANFYVASGWTEAISGGTIEVDGIGHATNEAVHFANGSNFTPTGGTFKMIGNDNSTIEVAEVTDGDFNFYNLTIGDGTNTKTVDIDAASATPIDATNDILIDANATFDTNSEPVKVGGNWNNNGTFTADNGMVTFNSSDTTNYIDAGTGSFYDITFEGGDGSGTWYFQNDNASISHALDVDTNDIVSINNGVNVTWTGTSFTLDGTISGLGRLIVDSSTIIPTSGTLTCTVRFDSTNGNTSVIPARTYGTVEPYNSSSTNARTIILGTTSLQTIDIGGYLYISADGTQNITLSGTDNNPSVIVDKTLDFTGTGGGTENVISGSGNWNVSGNVDFTDGTYTASTGNTLRMNGTDKTITSAGQTLQNFEIYGNDTTSIGSLDVNGTFTVSSGQFIQATDADLNVAGDFTLSSGTTFTAASGTGKLYLDGDLTLTDNTLVKQDLGDLNIGTSPDTTDLASDIAAKGITVNSGDVLNSHGYDMTIGVYGLNVIGSMDLTDDVETDETFITTDGDVTFGAASSITEDQSTITFDAATGTDNIFNPGSQNINNLVINGASLTVEVEDPIVVNNDLTITSGTLDVVSGENNQISLGGDWTNSGTFSAQNGTVVLTGSSTQNMSGTMTSTSQFYNLTVSNSSGSYSGCSTSFTPGVDFAASADIAGTFTITTGDAKVEYNSGSTYAANNINWNGGAYGDEIIFRNSNLTSGTWTLDVSGTQTAVKYVNVGRSDASSGDTINAQHISNVDCENTSNWEFDSITLSISDTTIGFGDLTSANARFANGAATGSDSKVAAHTITAYTAADNGYLLTYYGALLTSGSDTITGATITNDDDGTAGTEQFGLGITTAGDCTINADYNANSPAEYKFVANTTTTLCSETAPTTAEVISAYYIANIAADTEAGSYSSDVTYIMTATF